MLVSWAHTYGKHDVGALIGYEESRNWGDEVDICKEGMSSVNLTDFDAMTDPYYIKGSSYEYSSRSWFGRINYAFDNRYLFEMNMRYDGSSRFSPDSRWGAGARRRRRPEGAFLGSAVSTIHSIRSISPSSLSVTMVTPSSRKVSVGAFSPQCPPHGVSAKSRLWSRRPIG